MKSKKKKKEKVIRGPTRTPEQEVEHYIFDGVTKDFKLREICNSLNEIPKEIIYNELRRYLKEGKIRLIQKNFFEVVKDKTVNVIGTKLEKFKNVIDYIQEYIYANPTITTKQVKAKFPKLDYPDVQNCIRRFYENGCIAHAKKGEYVSLVYNGEDLPKTENIEVD